MMKSSMTKTRLLIVSLAVTSTLLLAGTGRAQPDGNRSDRNGTDRNGTDRTGTDRSGDRNTADRKRGGGSRLPAAGTALPELTIFDETGNEFSTKVLREHYTVIVFGCLT